ncbi:ABC transporter substrate-binding protein [soil metagenome]
MQLTRRKRQAVVALFAAASLTLAACGGSTESKSDSAIISSKSTEPQNPLIPTNTTEVGGGNVIDFLFAGLVSYQVDGTPENEMATSIESTDNVNWTIKIKPGWTFTDGTPVTANSFVDAWNFGAYSKNAQLNSYFFEPIKGYAETSAKNATVDALEGLKVVDDSTFTVELNQPESDFPTRLGYTAYFPLPAVAYDDMKAYGENPIGNGPYKFAKKGAWEHNKQISLVTNPDYKGNRAPKNDGVTFVMYTSDDSAYTDVEAGNLDIIQEVPESALENFMKSTDVQGISQPGSVFQSFTIPERLEHFGNDEEGRLRRQALSEAIDRKTITEKIFFGSRTPATDFGSPVLPGYSKDLAGGDVLEYNPENAKKLWAQADAIEPWSGTFKIAYNADKDNKGWVDATTNSIKNVLGIKSSGDPEASFDNFRERITSRKIETAFRTGWQADYPSLYNYLAPLYASAAADGAGSNDGDYKSKEFDAFLSKAASSDSDDARIQNLQSAEGVLLKDLPSIPLWYENVSSAAALDVSNVKINWKNVPEFVDIKK